jgi:hypothetical protein
MAKSSGSRRPRLPLLSAREVPARPKAVQRLALCLERLCACLSV